jgi:hypothetical protein
MLLKGSIIVFKKKGVFPLFIYLFINNILFNKQKKKWKFFLAQKFKTFLSLEKLTSASSITK